MPVGGDGFSRYVLLEVHYNNPNKRSGKNVSQCWGSISMADLVICFTARHCVITA